MAISRFLVTVALLFGAVNATGHFVCHSTIGMKAVGTPLATDVVSSVSACCDLCSALQTCRAATAYTEASGQVKCTRFQAFSAVAANSGYQLLHADSIQPWTQCAGLPTAVVGYARPGLVVLAGAPNSQAVSISTGEFFTEVLAPGNAMWVNADAARVAAYITNQGTGIMYGGINETMYGPVAVPQPFAPFAYNADSHVYFYPTPSGLYAVQYGEVIWSSGPIGGANASAGYSTGLPGGVLSAATMPNSYSTLAAFDQLTGSQLWNASSTITVAPDASFIFVTGPLLAYFAQGNVLYAVNVSDGNVAWQYTGSQAAVFTLHATGLQSNDQGVLLQEVSSSGTTNVLLVDNGGNLVWRYTVGQSLSLHMTLSADDSSSVVVLADTNALTVLEATTGAVKYTVAGSQLPGAYNGGITAGDGYTVAVVTNGTVSCAVGFPLK